MSGGMTLRNRRDGLNVLEFKEFVCIPFNSEDSHSGESPFLTECEVISVDQSVRALVKEGVYNTLACDIVSIQIGTLQV
jgi:hypothetical protein